MPNKNRVFVGYKHNSTLKVYRYPDKKPPSKKKQIRFRSVKREKEEKLYREKTRPEYLAEHPVCEIQFAGCIYTADQIHHSKGRVGKLLNDKRYFKSACSPCHHYTEEHPAEAKKKGVSKNRLT